MLCLEHGINHDGSVGDKGLNDPIAASIFFAESHANRFESLISQGKFPEQCL